MVINKENIILRAVEPSDVEIILQWENNPESWHLSNTLMPFSRFDIEQFVFNASKDIFATKQLRLMVDLNQNNETYQAGCIDLFDFEPMHQRAGLGILIDQDYRNRGIASITIDLIVEYAFKTLNLHQLYCNIESDNGISLTLFQKKGFQIIGLKKEWNLRAGEWVDEYILQLLNKN